MFEDGPPIVSEFQSVWQKSKKFKESSAQATPLPSVDVEVQVKDTPINIGIQTESETQENIENINDRVSNDVNLSEKDNDKLKRFLDKVAPEMERLLEKNLLSYAFDGYQVSWEDEVDSITCINEFSFSKASWTEKPKNHNNINGTIELDDEEEENEKKEDVIISSSCLSWNSTGTILAVGFGGLNHQGWCTHDGALCTWSVFRKPEKGRKPDVIVDTDSCVLAISFHPVVPTLISVGTFNGEIIVCDISQLEQQSSNFNEDPFVASSRNIDYNFCHREPISKIEWFPKSTKMQSYMMSISGDGKVLQWSLSKKLESSPYILESLRTFTLTNRPSNFSGNERESKISVAGGTAMSLSYEDTDVFVVGTEAGKIYKCSTSNLPSVDVSKSVSGSIPKSDVVINPIAFSYEAHVGAISGLSFHPFHRNLFLSCGQDTSIHLYHLLKTKPIINYIPSEFPILDISWSPTRPLVFVAASSDGNLYIYDLRKSRVRASVTLNVSNSGVCVVDFNKNNPGYLATGAIKGGVKVWRLSGILTNQTPYEKEILDAIGKS